MIVGASTRHTRSREEIADAPAYFISEAAHYLSLPTKTVRDWSSGRDYNTQDGPKRFLPLIRTADPVGGHLSFRNLAELHVLASIRRVHKVKLKFVRSALKYLESKLGSKCPLLDHQMLTDGTSLFIERYSDLLNISKHGQLQLKGVLSAYLRRIEWDEKHIPIRLFPFSRPVIENSPTLIAIDPRIRSGRPCITGTGVPTSIIAERHKAGDSISHLALDYGRSSEEIEEALRYESGAAA